ncbi:hypothetical protein AURANDRAFT_21219, partial [Aureococcus anophagefferens]
MGKKEQKDHAAAEQFERAKLREQFDRIDTDGSGKVDKFELKFLLRKVTGSTPTDDEVEAIMQDIDTSGDGLVDFSEF